MCVDADSCDNSVGILSVKYMFAETRATSFWEDFLCSSFCMCLVDTADLKVLIEHHKIDCKQRWTWLSLLLLSAQREAAVKICITKSFSKKMKCLKGGLKHLLFCRKIRKFPSGLVEGLITFTGCGVRPESWVLAGWQKGWFKSCLRAFSLRIAWFSCSVQF